MSKLQKIPGYLGWFLKACLPFLLIILATAGCGGAPAEVTTAPDRPAATAQTRDEDLAPTATRGQELAPTATPRGTADGDPITASGNASTPITTELALSHAPLLQETARLTFTVRTVIPVASANATITLPGGATLVDGTLQWQGPLTPEEPQTMFATIRFVEEGNWTIEGKALSPQENGDVWGDASQIYLYVSAEVSHPGFAEGDQEAVPEDSADVPTPPGIDAQP